MIGPQTKFYSSDADTSFENAFRDCKNLPRESFSLSDGVLVNALRAMIPLVADNIKGDKEKSVAAWNESIAQYEVFVDKWMRHFYLHYVCHQPFKSDEDSEEVTGEDADIAIPSYKEVLACLSPEKKSLLELLLSFRAGKLIESMWPMAKVDMNRLFNLRTQIPQDYARQQYMSAVTVLTERRSALLHTGPC